MALCLGSEGPGRYKKRGKQKNDSSVNIESTSVLDSV